MSSPAISNVEQQAARELLCGSRDVLLSLIAALPTESWHRRPAGDVWTIAQNVEHLYLVEAGLMKRLPQAPYAAGADSARDWTHVGRTIARDVRITAPETVIPAGRITAGTDLMAAISRARQKSLDWLDDPASDHRRHVLPHPFFGPLDGYQWLLFLAAHMQRHTAQIRELLLLLDAHSVEAAVGEKQRDA